MTEVVAYAVRDGVAVITMNNPPVNGLGTIGGFKLFAKPFTTS